MELSNEIINLYEKCIKDIVYCEKCNQLNINSHELALTHYIKSMQNEFIFICDDWNRNDWNVEEITRNTIKKLNLNILYENALPINRFGDLDLWWSGFYVSVLKN